MPITNTVEICEIYLILTAKLSHYDFIHRIIKSHC